MWIRQRNLKRETDYLLIPTKNNAIGTNHIKGERDKTQQNIRCRLCDDRDETINHIISECSKLEQKEYKTGGGQGYPLGIVQEVVTWTYEQMVYAQPRICPGEWNTQTPQGFWHANGSPYLGQTNRPYNNPQKRRTCRIVDFVVPAEHRVKLKESEKVNKYLDLARELKKLWKMKLTVITFVIVLIVIGALGRVTKDLSKDGWLGNKGTGGDCPNYGIFKIGQNTENSPGKLRRLAVTHTLPVKNHH